MIELVQAEKSTRYNRLSRIRKTPVFSSDAVQAKGRGIVGRARYRQKAGRSDLPRTVDCAKKASSKAGPPPNVLTTRWLHATHMKKYLLLAEQRSTKEQV